MYSHSHANNKHVWLQLQPDVPCSTAGIFFRLLRVWVRSPQTIYVLLAPAKGVSNVQNGHVDERNCTKWSAALLVPAAARSSIAATHVNPFGFAAEKTLNMLILSLWNERLQGFWAKAPALRY